MPIYGTLAFVFHWQPGEMKALPLDQLMAFYDQAVAILKAKAGAG